MFELLETYSLLGIQHFASIILGLVRTKILAVTLGPYGVGIASQAISFFVMIQGIVALGMGGGFTKLIAEYKSHEDYESINKTLITLMVVYVSAGLVLLGVSIVFAQPLSAWAFDDPAYGNLIIMVAAAGVIWSQYLVVLFLFRGLFKWREYTQAATIGYAFNILLSVGLIYWLGVTGAVLSIVVAQAINLMIAEVILHRNVMPHYQLDYWHYRPDKQIFRALLRYMGPVVSVQFFATFAGVFIRSEIIRELGAEANGYFQAVWGISLAYMGFIINAVHTYGVPKVASLLGERDERVRVQNNMLRMGLLLTSPITIILLCFREIWIPLLYSAAFMVAGPLLFWQFAADLIRVIRQNMNVVLVPLERLGYLLVDGTLLWGGWILLSMIFIPRFGLIGVPMAYFLINILMLLVAYLYHRRVIGFVLSSENKAMVAKLGLLLGAGFVIAYAVTSLPARIILSGGVIVLMLLWLPSRYELAQTGQLLKRFTNRNQS
jgi:O-antigen/teichoic acid export membrane protein